MKKTILLLPVVMHLFLLSGCTQTNSPKPVDKGNGIYSITVGEVYLEIDAKSGARISSLKLKDKEFLFMDKTSDNWGSTFWTSPQSAWSWPPVVSINSAPYSGKIEGANIDLTGEKDEKLGFVIHKKLTGNTKDTSFSIVYTITNNSNEVKQVAPWEITRLHPGGLTVFPAGKPGMRGDLVPLVKDSSGIMWFKYKAEEIPSGIPKFFGDGSEGWIAQVMDNMVLIKTFKDIDPAKAAPEEAEIELYANQERTYIEVEQQGEYMKLDKGNSSSWEVKWCLRALPAGIKAEVGNMELVKFIRKTVE